MALLDIRGLGPAGVRQLIQRYGSVKELVTVIEAGGDGDDRLLQKAVSGWKTLDWTRYDEALTIVDSLGGRVCSLEDAEYPKNLRSIPTAPPVLYYRGSLDALSTRALALVGTTKPSDRGRRRAALFARTCVENGIQVVSGLARGIDTTSHQATLVSGGLTFAILGHGLDHLFPPENAELSEKIVENGALISPFMPGTPPTRWTFPARNEVMCTLSLGTVIVEIEQNDKFGSVIQARYSLKHGRPVFVLQSNVTELDSPVARDLIEQDGAVLVSDFSQVLRCMDTHHAALHEWSDPQLGLPLMKDGSSPRDAEHPLDALLFDLDGVLFDASDSVVRAYVATIKEVTGRNVAHEEIEANVWKSPTVVLRDYGISYSDGMRVYNRHVMRNLQDGHWTIHEPVVRFARELRASGVLTGIVTSQPRGRCSTVLSLCGWQDLFDVTITWSDVPRGRGKPKPDSIERALRALATPPHRAAYIGDSVTDMLAARNARVRAIAACWGADTYDRLKRFSPDLYLMNPADIGQILTDLPRVQEGQ